MSALDRYLNGVSFVREKKYAEAVGEFSEALALQPLNPEALYCRAHAYLLLGDVRRGFTDLDKCTQLCPAYGLAHLWKARILHHSGCHEQAAGSYELAEEHLGTEFDFHQEMGLSYALIRRFDKAILHFDLCPDPGLSKVIAISNKAHCLDELGRHREAIASCDQAIAIDPRFPVAWYNKAVAHASLGEFEPAKRSFLKYLERHHEGDHAEQARSFVMALDTAAAAGNAIRKHRVRQRRYPRIALPCDRDSSVSLSPGDQLGPNWLVVDLLGGTPMRATFLVFNKRTGAYGVAKGYPQEEITRTKREEDWERQIRLWIELGRHPNVCVPYRVELRNGTFFTFSEYIGSRTADSDNSLLHLIRTGSVGHAQAVRWGIQLCNALIYAQDHGVPCHYNLKPGNILVDSCGNLRVTDFDFAGTLPLHDPCACTMPASPDLFPFVPSGRFHFLPVDPRHDVYSIGILLSLMTTGRHPLASHAVQCDADAWERLHSDGPPTIIHSPLESVIGKCIAKSPESRYRSFEDLREDLAVLHERMTGHPCDRPVLLPDTPERLYHLAVTLSTLGKPAEALQLCRKALQTDPFHAATWLNMGSILEELCRTSQAQYCYTKVIKLGGPFSPLAWNNVGCIRTRQRRFHEAVFCFERSLEIDPLYSNAWCNMGRAQQELNRMENALESLRKAATIDPRNRTALHTLSRILLKQGNWEEAMPVFKAFLTMEPLNMDGWLSLCHAQYNAGCYSEALLSAETVLQLTPGAYRVHLFKAYCFVALGNRSAAAEAFNAYAVLSPPEESAIVAAEKAKLFDGSNAAS